MVDLFIIMAIITVLATISFAFVRMPEYVPHLRSMDNSPGGGSPKNAVNAYKKNLEAVDANELENRLSETKGGQSEFRKDINSVITMLVSKRIRPILL